MSKLEVCGPAQKPSSPDDVRVLPVLAFALFPLPVHHRGIHVRRREGVRFVEEGDDAQQDGPGGEVGSQQVQGVFAHATHLGAGLSGYAQAQASLGSFRTL